ncbi:hypothetical protein OIU79_021648 [Salix purpurea]|uniref:Uncharacterized protein n=1 Tax=Salix purpurea TaxID=77065 RepID=A0A9Q1ABZ2_SALPP|nr:hypothetical protein OIU79_021648 [Salix purpurea]
MNYEHFEEKSSKTMAIFLEEQIRVSKEERIEMTAENISQVVQGQSKLIEEGKYRQPAEGVDEGRPGKEVHMIENEANEERSQLQLQEIQVTEDLHNVKDNLKFHNICTLRNILK